MSTELSSILDAIEKEKGIPREALVDALRQALASACRKSFPKSEAIEIDIDLKTGHIRVLDNGKELFHPDFGRIAAQTAKQVIIQKLREAERETIFGDFSKRMGEIAVGNVHRVENRAIIVNLGRSEGILPAREQSPADDYRQGDVIRAYVLEVKKSPRGPEIILSRAHENLVKKLFEIEVPEIHDGIVEIKAVSREAGSRTKIAVFSRDDKIDSVGSCVGMRGQRVKNVVREVEGEKIDIVRWNEDPETFIRNALSPAELAEVKLYAGAKRAEIFVHDDQLSLAIGKKGQNVRLASKLTGWQLDVRPMSQKVSLESVEGIGLKISEALKKAGISSVRDLLKMSSEDLQKIEGIGAKTAEKILASAHQAVKAIEKKEAETGGESKREAESGEKLEDAPVEESSENQEEDSAEKQDLGETVEEPEKQGGEGKVSE